MLADWIYTTPIWLSSLVILVVALVLALGGLLLAHRLIDFEFRRHHNELTGFVIAVIGVVYAVLLAFIAIATWEAYTEAELTAGEEATYVGNIFRDTAGLPDAIAAPLRTDLRRYLETVINVEWPAQQAGHISGAGWSLLEDTQLRIADYEPQTKSQTALQQEWLRSLNQLYALRRHRLLAAQGHVPPLVWWVILLGGAITVGYTYLFGATRFLMHLILTAAVTLMLTLDVILIVQLDYPFRGTVSVSAEAYETVLDHMRRLSSPPEASR